MQTSSPAAAAVPSVSLPARIAEHCESLSYITTGIFVISLFLSILRPDPTLAVCLFGFYGAHVRSKGAIRSFWVFLLLTICVDVMWLVEYSALRPFTFEQLQLMTRREQVAVALSVLNVLYKLVVVFISIRLQILFGRREEAVAEQAEAAVATYPNGAPVDYRSLASKDTTAGSSQLYTSSI